MPVLVPDKVRMISKYDLQAIKFCSYKILEKKIRINKAIERRGSCKEPFEDISELIKFLNDLFRQLPDALDLSVILPGSNNYERVNTTQQENFILLSDRNKSIVYYGSELFDYVYRGQSQDYGKCVPSLFRNIDIDNLEHVENKLIKITKTMEFENSINLHPYIKIIQQFNSGFKLTATKKSPDLPGSPVIYTPHTEYMAHYLNRYPLYIHNIALAQHHGYETHLLDATTNLEVAAFFAVCDFNRSTNQYELSNKDIGVIYVIPWYQYDMKPRKQGDIFNIVGWQPLERTTLQRACVFNMAYGDDLNNLKGVIKLYFKHNKTKSLSIYKKYKDKIMELDYYTKCFIENLKLIKIYDERTFYSAYKRLQIHFKNKIPYTFGALISSLNSKNIVSNNPIILPTPNLVINEEAYLNHYVRLLNKLHYRRIEHMKGGNVIDRYLQHMYFKVPWLV